MNNKSITTIVVLYYSKHLLSDLIKNINDEITDCGEIILVDNSNEDLSEFATSSVKVLHPTKNLGYGGAINLGVNKAKYANILIINPDIIIKQWQMPTNTLESRHFILSGKPHEWPCMRKFPNIVYDFFRFALGNLGWPFGWIRNQYGKIQITSTRSLQPVDWVSGTLIITNKETLEIIGGFDENYFLFYEEVDLCKRASMLNIPVLISSQITFLCRQGTASSRDVNKIKFSSSIQSAQIYHSKYTNPFYNHCFFKLLKIHCKAICSLLSLCAKINNSSKISAKIKQYDTYHDNII